MSYRDAAFVLDLSFWAHRAWHAVVRDTPAGGTPSMLAAFANMLVKLLAEREPRFLFVAAEMEGPTWRHELFPAYKAHREPHPPGFDRQLAEIVRLLSLHRFPVLGAAGFEADDVIARVVREVRAASVPVVIITADKDLRQLVTDAAPMVVLWDGKDRWVGERTVRKEWSIGPERVGDFLALVGDPGDGIPGVHGVGEKRAPELLERAGGLEEVIRKAVWWKPAIAAAVRENAEQIRLARRLVELRDAPVTVDLEVAEVRPERWDREGIRDFYEQAGLSRLAARMKEP